MKKDQIIYRSIIQIRCPVHQVLITVIRFGGYFNLFQVICELYEIDLVNAKYRYIAQLNQLSNTHTTRLWWFGGGAGQRKELSCTATS